MKILQSPALHMAVLGALLFVGLDVWGGAGDGTGFAERPRVVVPQHRLERVHRDFVEDHYRLPTPEEREGMVDMLIDDEVLYQYALALGMEEHSAAQQRLALIADFVEANPHHGATDEDKAAAAVELGLHHGDLVVRRILVDAARRVLRGPALLQPLAPEAVEAHYAEHGVGWAVPARTRLELVTVNGFKGQDPEGRARDLLARIRAESLNADAAQALGEASPAPRGLPLLTEEEVAARMGYGFAAAVMEQPAGSWAGPIESRHGYHLVWVAERSEARAPRLEEVRSRIEDDLRQEMADRRLEHRLAELRQDFDVVRPSFPVAVVAEADP